MINPALRTIIYFDCLDFALTKLELLKWLKIENSNSAPIGDVLTLEAELDKLSEKVEVHNGLIFLKGRAELVSKRLAGYRISERQFKRARSYAILLSWLPFVRTVLVSNTLAYGNVHSESDIDLAVIVKKNRLWLTRFLSVGLFHLLRVRPKQTQRFKAIDLNVFISEEKLNLSSLMFDEDFVFPFWLSQLVCLYDRGSWNEFKLSNEWLKDYFPNFYWYDLASSRKIQKTWIAESVRVLLKIIFDWNAWEIVTQKYQKKILPPELKNLINQDSRVIINRQILKFHQSDNWHRLKEELQRKYEKYGV